MEIIKNKSNRNHFSIIYVNHVRQERINYYYYYLKQLKNISDYLHNKARKTKPMDDCWSYFIIFSFGNKISLKM